MMMSLLRKIREQLYWNDPSYRIPFILFICMLLVVAVVVFCFAVNSYSETEPDTVLIYCFSAMEDVMEEAILPAFQNYWYENTGQKVKFITTYSGSGLISSRTILRFKAQIIILASVVDAYQLSLTKIVTHNIWENLPEGGKLCYTPIILYSKKELGVSEIALEDLDFAELNIMITDPVSSGAGQWALLALYGSLLRSGATELEATTYLTEVLDNVMISSLNAKAAFVDFANSNADLLLTYEAFGSSAHSGGQQSALSVYPIRTIMAEPVVVPVSRNIWDKEQPLLDSFIQYLWSWEAQTLLMDYGFRVHYEDFQNNIRQIDSQDIFRSDSLGDPQILLEKIIDPLNHLNLKQFSAQ
ncbi:MAG: substrate-binding domain-containing protein [Candidatus Marinimicrobia bacterium]|nr:substrate-binding domain-containing protein [Candidatus Neomarinimicrobiota bacterium]